MHTAFLSAVILGFSALANATFSSPKSGDKWSKGSSQSISWDKSSLSSGKCNIHLVPAGAKDATTIISEIALQTDNSGSFAWTPSSSISVAEAEIIIIDSKQSTIISSIFQLVSGSDSKDSKGYNNGYDSGSKETQSKSYEHANHTKTYETKSHGTRTETKGSTATSLIIISVSGLYSTGSTSFTTTQVTTTIAGAATTYAATSLALSETTTKSVASAGGALASLSSNATLAVSATPTAPLPFTGDAPRSMRVFYGTAISFAVVLAAVLL